MTKILRPLMAFLLIAAFPIEAKPTPTPFSSDQNLFTSQAVVTPLLAMEETFDVQHKVDLFKEIFGISQAALEKDVAKPYSKRFRVEKLVIVPQPDGQFEITGLAYHQGKAEKPAAYLKLSSHKDGSVTLVTNPDNDARWPNKLESMVLRLLRQKRLKTKLTEFTEAGFKTVRQRALAKFQAAEIAMSQMKHGLNDYVEPERLGIEAEQNGKSAEQDAANASTPTDLGSVREQLSEALVDQPLAVDLTPPPALTSIPTEEPVGPTLADQEKTVEEAQQAVPLPIPPSAKVINPSVPVNEPIEGKDASFLKGFLNRRELLSLLQQGPWSDPKRARQELKILASSHRELQKPRSEFLAMAQEPVKLARASIFLNPEELTRLNILLSREEAEHFAEAKKGFPWEIFTPRGTAAPIETSPTHVPTQALHVGPWQPGAKIHWSGHNWKILNIMRSSESSERISIQVESLGSHKTIAKLETNQKRLIDEFGMTPEQASKTMEVADIVSEPQPALPQPIPQVETPAPIVKKPASAAPQSQANSETFEEGQARMRRIIRAALVIEPNLSPKYLVENFTLNPAIKAALHVCRENLQKKFYPDLEGAIAAVRLETGTPAPTRIKPSSPTPSSLPLGAFQAKGIGQSRPAPMRQSPQAHVANPIPPPAPKLTPVESAPKRPWGLQPATVDDKTFINALTKALNGESTEKPQRLQTVQDDFIFDLVITPMEKEVPPAVSWIVRIKPQAGQETLTLEYASDLMWPNSARQNGFQDSRWLEFVRQTDKRELAMPAGLESVSLFQAARSLFAGLYPPTADRYKQIGLSPQAQTAAHLVLSAFNLAYLLEKGRPENPQMGAAIRSTLIRVLEFGIINYKFVDSFATLGTMVMKIHLGWLGLDYSAEHQRPPDPIVQKQRELRSRLLFIYQGFMLLTHDKRLEELSTASGLTKMTIKGFLEGQFLGSVADTDTLEAYLDRTQAKHDVENSPKKPNDPVLKSA